MNSSSGLFHRYDKLSAGVTLQIYLCPEGSGWTAVYDSSQADYRPLSERLDDAYRACLAYLNSAARSGSIAQSNWALELQRCLTQSAFWFSWTRVSGKQTYLVLDLYNSRPTELLARCGEY